MSQQEENQSGYNQLDGGEEGISISELFHIFRQRLGWFVIGFVVVVVAAIGYLQLAVPQYESQLSVLVEPIQKSSSIENFLESSASTTKIATEVELITSRKNIEYALGTLDLTSYKDGDGLSYANKEVLGVVKDRIVVSTVKDTNIVRITVTDANPAFARDLANALASSYDNLLTGIAKNSKTAQREFIQSQIPINDHALQLASDALGDFRENSDIIQLTDKSSLLVEQISYYALRLEPLRLQLDESLVFINSYNSGLQAAGVEGILSLDAIRTDPVVAAKLDDLTAWKTELTMYESLVSPSPAQASTATASSGSSRSYVLNSAISQTTKDLLDRVTVLTRSYAKDANIQAIVQALTTEVAINVLHARGEVFVAELSKLPVLERKLSELERDVQISEAIGLKLRDMLEEVKLVEAAVTGNVTVVDQAVLPLLPVSPNKMLILAVALLLGCAIGFLLALAAEATDFSLRTEAQVKKITGLDTPMLGWIPLMKISPKDKYPTLTVFNDPLSFESERFKLVANMLYSKVDEQVFSITSCSMAEGKSTIIGNIALSFAQMGSKVLIIDGDLRLPSMERFFRLKHSETGLVDYVVGRATLEQCIIQPLDNVENLHLLPPGAPPLVPAAIFSNPAYIKMIKYLRTIYDFIIIDAPPLDSASELLAICKQVDGLITTVRAGVTTKGALADLVASLKTGNVPLTGIVFNGVIPGSTGSYGYGYGNRYGSYSSRYASYGNRAEVKKKHVGNRRKNSSWYRRKYRRDLAQRGRSVNALYEPVLAFGPDASFATLDSWTGFSMYSPISQKAVEESPMEREKVVAPPAVDVVKVVEPVASTSKEPIVAEDALFDSLSAIESDSDSKGKI
ncbi:polysaccharide biosynthesis tyrosine autokinase [Sphaerochaeta sp. PS]|uniref:GumC family protein n=1 Tax=Sphaerochaeta sp. PS TaxID=3076336 RepID=UPI0028A46842|nr:polysaccharide biosynthesis tyrosine autokinase [Sphaerochaeta sp. PS]MDT4762338.1 polysaccharide biosynthesis tyrosine autokinase [Sphaerochaeta sp. PS]